MSLLVDSVDILLEPMIENLLLGFDAPKLQSLKILHPLHFFFFQLFDILSEILNDLFHSPQIQYPLKLELFE